MRRFYDPQPFVPGTETALTDDVSHHISRVLRMQPGDELVLFNGEGGEWHARISAVGKRQVSVVPLQHVADNRTPDIPLQVVLPLLKGDRMDYALQKATELGAGSFQPVITERTEARSDGGRIEKRMHHWQQVVISACEQCGMNRVPQVLTPLSLRDWLAQPRQGLGLIAHPGEQPLEKSVLMQASAISLLTGPEGGFSNTELALARDAGLQPFALGNRVLRAETAPPALMAAIWMARQPG